MDNIKVMVPFCRTPEEGKRDGRIIRREGLRGQVGVMADQFARIFDFFSIGSNDLTQLVLGIDRDNEKLSGSFDERNEAVKIMMKELIVKARKAGKEVGICG